MNKLKIIFLIILTFIISSKTFAEDKVKIGVMLHLSGDFADWGRSYLEGIELALDEYKINNPKEADSLKLFVEDTKFNPLLSLTAAKKLIDFKNVNICLISTFTEAKAVAFRFEESKTPLLVIGDSDEELDKMGQYVFSIGSDTKGYGTSASSFLIDTLNLKEASIINTNNPWSETTATNFKKHFQESDGKIISSYQINPDENDFKSILSKIKNDNPKAIFAPLTSNSLTFFKQLRELKIDVPTITAGGALDTDVINALKTDSEGLYVTNSYLDIKRPLASKLVESYKVKYKKEMAYPSVTARGYDGMITAFQALKLSPDKSKETIKEALYKIDIEGAGSKIKISSEGGSRLPVSILKVEGGTLKAKD